MIDVDGAIFRLNTRTSSYWFEVTEHGHLEHLHYGPLLTTQDPSALRVKRTIQHGSSVVYAPDDHAYTLDAIPLEYSGIGQGDYRGAPLEVWSTHGTDTDFTYRSHRIHGGALPIPGLPTADAATDAGTQTLDVTLADDRAGLELTLVYTVFPATDVITRRARLTNTGDAPVEISHLASLQLDLQDRGFTIRTFDGNWIHEAHAHDRPVSSGTFSIGSTTGASSNRHNPGIVLYADGTTEDTGWAYGVNLVYSGNHRTSVERDSHGSVRILTGIQPQGFRWPLPAGDSFEAPEAVLTFAADGLNGVSDRMHRFVNAHITPASHRGADRPVVYNSWEAVMFGIDEKRLLSYAKKAASLGVEMFVIDDGWFTGRVDDFAALGDYTVDAKKFPNGFGPLVSKVNKLGMQAGIWVEPEMVNENSELYRTHPDWALRIPGKEPREGRHQQVLDFCNPAVRDYVVEQVGRLVDDNGFSYVKWDMNRHIADAFSPHVAHPGMTAHAYMLGLYEVLERIFTPRPHVLLEMCSSGGNRFDLGMLRYAAMIWSSDDTDAIERISIQAGLSHLYPPAVISNHVSAAPHAQTLRDTPLSTRFNVAAFGCLGYEYDLDFLTAEDTREIVEQIAFYTEHRRTFQFGRFRRQSVPRALGNEGRCVWQVGDAALTFVGNFQRGVRAAPERDILAVRGLDADARYTVDAKPQRLMLDRLGALVNHVSPVKLDPNGIVMNVVSRHKSLPDADEHYAGTGALLAAGIRLHMQFAGTGHTATLRMLGDNGSTLYTVRREDTL